MSGGRSLPFDRVAHIYDETRGGEDRGRRFAAELDPYLDRSRCALEVGVGTGVVALGLKALGHDVVGVDLSFPMLERARQRIGPRVMAGDAHRLPIRDASFDQAYSVWVTHVAGDVTGLLHEVARVIRPGGRYLVVPALGDRPADPIGGAIRTMQRILDPAGMREGEEVRLREAAPACGLRVTAAHDWAPHDYEETPAEALRKIETRSYSMLWDVTDEQWERAVVPTIEALRALPDPERPIRRVSNDRLLILEREP